MSKRRESEQQKVYAQVKGKIILGLWRSGHSLKEALVAEELGYGELRTPVRQALAILVRECVAYDDPDQGLMVPKFTSEELAILVERRYMVEAWNSWQLAKEQPKELRESLLARANQHNANLRALAESAKKKPLTTAELVRWSDEDLAVHLAIAKAASSFFYRDDFISKAYYATIIAHPAFRDPERQQVVPDEHQEVIDHVIEGHWKEATAACYKHLLLSTLHWFPMSNFRKEMGDFFATLALNCKDEPVAQSAIIKPRGRDRAG